MARSLQFPGRPLGAAAASLREYGAGHVNGAFPGPNVGVHGHPSKRPGFRGCGKPAPRLFQALVTPHPLSGACPRGCHLPKAMRKAPSNAVRSQSRGGTLSPRCAGEVSGRPRAGLCATGGQSHHRPVRPLRHRGPTVPEKVALQPLGGRVPYRAWHFQVTLFPSWEQQRPPLPLQHLVHKGPLRAHPTRWGT